MPDPYWTTFGQKLERERAISAAKGAAVLSQSTTVGLRASGRKLRPDDEKYRRRRCGGYWKCLRCKQWKRRKDFHELADGRVKSRCKKCDSA